MIRRFLKVTLAIILMPLVLLEGLYYLSVWVVKGKVNLKDPLYERSFDWF